MENTRPLRPPAHILQGKPGWHSCCIPTAWHEACTWARVGTKLAAILLMQESCQRQFGTARRLHSANLAPATSVPPPKYLIPGRQESCQRLAQLLHAAIWHTSDKMAWHGSCRVTEWLPVGRNAPARMLQLAKRGPLIAYTQLPNSRHDSCREGAARRLRASNVPTTTTHRVTTATSVSHDENVA